MQKQLNSQQLARFTPRFLIYKSFSISMNYNFGTYIEYIQLCKMIATFICKGCIFFILSLIRFKFAFYSFLIRFDVANVQIYFHLCKKK